MLHGAAPACPGVLAVMYLRPIYGNVEMERVVRALVVVVKYDSLDYVCIYY